MTAYRISTTVISNQVEIARNHPGFESMQEDSPAPVHYLEEVSDYVIEIDENEKGDDDTANVSNDDSCPSRIC